MLDRRYSQWQYALSYDRTLARKNILNQVATHEEEKRQYNNMTAENKLYFQAEKEAIFLIRESGLERIVARWRKREILKKI
ncbi:hypothetical protein Tco_0264520 [Tanacetum coccineum]